MGKKERRSIKRKKEPIMMIRLKRHLGHTGVVSVDIYPLLFFRSDTEKIQN